MACIKRYLFGGLVVVLLSFLAACESMQGKKTEKADESAEVPAEALQQGELAEPPLELIPNPYLAQKPSVSGKAKQEFAKAKEAMQAKQWKQAEALLVLMTETWPELSGPWVNLGVSQLNQQQFEQAELSFQKAIEINNANMDAYTQLGVFYREQGRFQEAEQTYLAALQVWPHHPESHRNLGILYDLYMGKFEQALEHYRMLERILPEEDRQLKGWIRDLERRLPEPAE